MADPFVPITQPTTTTTLPSPSAAPSNSTTTTSGQKRALDMETTKPRSSKSCKTDPYRHLGRHFVRTIELTVDPYTIIKEGVKRVADTQNEFRPNYTIAYVLFPLEMKRNLLLAVQRRSELCGLYGPWTTHQYLAS